MSQCGRHLTKAPPGRGGGLAILQIIQLICLRIIRQQIQAGTSHSTDLKRLLGLTQL